MAKERMINQAAQQFYNDFENSLEIGRHFDSSRFKSILPSTLYDWNEGEDRFLFLKSLELIIETQKQEHFQNHHHDENTNCGHTNFYNELLYFVHKQLSDIRDNDDLSPEYFSTKEKITMSRKLDEMREHLAQEISKSIAAAKNELQLGQEILFNELDDLKNNTDLKKKTFYEVVKGKIFDSAIKKTVDPETLKWVYEQISGEALPRLLN